MNSKRLMGVLSLCLGTAFYAGCPSPTTDDVQGNDAADQVETGSDTSVTDTSTEDAQNDVQTDTNETDTGTTDAQTDTGTDAPTDGNTTNPLNGCETFTDRTAGSAERTIAFTGTSYTPNCMTIAAGQSVTFNGMFSFHPLAPGHAPSRLNDGPSTTPTPITATATGTTASFTFPAAGDYGYYCTVHEALGMYGVIRVQ